MNKRAILILCALVLFFGTAYVTTLKIDAKEKENTFADEIEVKDISENIIENENVVTTNAEETKTSPNTILVLEKKYTDCKHSSIEEINIPTNMVNLTKEELAEQYKSWKIEKFAKDKVTMCKEVASFCGEHFLVIEEQGIVSIYNLDENGNKSLREVCDIAVEYLPETDKIILKNRYLCVWNRRTK